MKRFLAVFIGSSIFMTGCSSTPMPLQSRPLANQVCSRIGEEIELSETKRAVCLLTKDSVSRYVEIDDEELALVPKMPNQLDPCKISDQRKNVEGPNSIAFPLVNQEIPITGNVKVALIPIDFPDVKGSKETLNRNLENVTVINEWLEEFSRGKLRYEWTVHNEWITAPKESKFYAYDHAVYTQENSTEVNESSQMQTGDEIEFQLFSEAEKKMNLDQVSYVFLLFPEGIRRIRTELSARNVVVETAEGNYQFGYWGAGKYFQRDDYLLWQAWIHEIMHSHGLALHAPDGPWTDRYETQPGSSAWLSWNSFISSWWGEEEVFCADREALDSPIEISLTPLDNPTDPGFKSLMLRLDDHRVLVVESRRQSKWTSIADGFYGIQAYVVDSKAELARCDTCEKNEEFLRKQWAYYLNSTGKNHKSLPQENYNHVAYVGESFEFEDLIIDFLQTGNFDTLRVSKVDF